MTVWQNVLVLVRLDDCDVYNLDRLLDGGKLQLYVNAILSGWKD